MKNKNLKILEPLRENTIEINNIEKVCIELNNIVLDENIPKED